jgi:putative salt-induced outer membrane protein
MVAACAVAPMVRAEEAPPAWEAKLGLSWLETSGNTDSSSLGFDATAVRRWSTWIVDADGKLLRAENGGETTADRWSLGARGTRELSPRMGLSAAARFEADDLAGLDRRTVVSGGVVWTLADTERWKAKLATELAWTDEQYADPLADTDFLGAVIDGRGEWAFSPSAKLLHRLGFWPSFDDSDDYRLLAEVAIQADLNSLLALRVGYEWRYDGVPAPGFVSSDRTFTAAVVLTAAAKR